MSSTRYNPWRLFHGAFVPNWLLERSEVSATAKLLFGMLCQHAGKKGSCFPRQDTLAAELGTTERSIRRFISELKNHRLIDTVYDGKIKSNVYFFTKHEWMASPVLDSDRLDLSGHSDSDRSDLAARDRTDLDGHLPLHIERKDSVLKDSVPENGERVEILYKIYPRKVGKPIAIKAINKALKKTPYEAVLSAVQNFAKSWQGHDLQFCPHPSTWFNQERYNDDPSTWVRREASNGPPVHIQIKTLEDAIDDHPANPTALKYDKREVTETMRADLRGMRTRVAELRKTLTNQITA